MGSQRRMFSRRSIAGLITGLLLGFNLASWFVIPSPTHTAIEIEVISHNEGGRLQREKFAEIRVGAARVRSNNKVGRDCDHESIEYGNIKKKITSRRAPPESNFQNDAQGDVDSNAARFGSDENFNENYNTIDDFDLQEERKKRLKELEIFYESDIENEYGEDFPKDNGRLEDFQLPSNVQKYVDYNMDVTIPENEGENLVQNNFNKEIYDEVEVNRDAAFSHFKTPYGTIAPHDKTHFMYVGVLTAEKYLSTRGRAILDTWANHIPGKVEFYVGEGVKNIDDGGTPLPLINLISVKDDVYPPQKKSFLLLKKMYESYLRSGYQWFMRADDDIYIKTDKLEKFLRRLNSSEPIFLGQTGLGNTEERGRLSLAHGDNYCMGGPGMIFSQEVLRRVGPHIRECVKHLYTWHEDVELSRCVRRFADINCAWSYQMQELFYEHYSLRKGYIDPYIEPNNPKLYSALTLHPNKNPAYQVKLHQFMNSQKIQDHQKRIKELSREIVNMDEKLSVTSGLEEYMLGISPSLRRFVPQQRNEVLTWDFMTDRLWFSAPPNQIRRTLPSDRQMTMRNMIMMVMRAMNSNSKVRGRIIDFKQVGYGYRRVNPLYGAEYVLDLLLVYKRYKGKKLTIPVRRHAYLQQTFTRLELQEVSPLDVDIMFEFSKTFRKNMFDSFLSSMYKNSMKLASSLGLLAQKNSGLVSDLDKHHLEDFEKLDKISSLKSAEYVSEESNVIRFDSGKFESFINDITVSDAPIVHIIIPLTGRYDTFQYFMANLEKICLSRGDPVSLLVILFKSGDFKIEEESRKTIKLLDIYAKRYPHYDIRIIPIHGEFSRGLGLELGASHFSNDSLLFFCDVDVIFQAEFIRKCRANTVLESRVYYPILFSEYHPNFQKVFSSWRNILGKTGDLSVLQDSSTVREMQVGKDHFHINKTLGYWRSYGYGLLCTYKSDFVATGGFDMSIQGWGMEDVDLIDKFTAGSRKSRLTKKETKPALQPKNQISVMRCVDPSLVHVYHPSHCDLNLSENQLRMCRASRASGIASVHRLAYAWSKRFSGKGKNVHIANDPVSELIPKVPYAQYSDLYFRHGPDRPLGGKNQSAHKVVKNPDRTSILDLDIKDVGVR